MKILMTCSGGGHLAQALALKSWWGEHERVWVTSPTADTRVKLAGEEVIESHYPTVRNFPNFVRNYGLAKDVMATVKPDLVFSTGAAIAVPFFLQARKHAAMTAHLEPVDRIHSTSLTGRMVYPLSDYFLVQWESMLDVVPDAINVGVVL